jgi:hypothetical protein
MAVVRLRRRGPDIGVQERIIKDLLVSGRRAEFGGIVPQYRHGAGVPTRAQ